MVVVVVVVVAGTRRASKNRFLKTGGGANAGCSRALGGYLTVGGRVKWERGTVGEEGEIGWFFVFLFVGDIIIGIQKRGERESQE